MPGTQANGNGKNNWRHDSEEELVNRQIRERTTYPSYPRKVVMRYTEDTKMQLETITGCFLVVTAFVVGVVVGFLSAAVW